MPWPRTDPPAPSGPPAIPPSGEALRIAALQASWARDRRVGKRRLALRWLVWGLWRYVLPALLVLAASALVWIWLLPTVRAHLPLAPSHTADAPPSRQPGPTVAPNIPLEVVVSEPLLPISQTHAPDAGGDPPATDPLPLRFESHWSRPRSASVGPEITDSVPPPKLKPENWLHSKEP